MSVPSRKVAALLFQAAFLVGTGSWAQSVHHETIDAEPIAAAQQKSNWCWAAGCEMLARSQGVELSQSWFVNKVFGPALPNFPTGGSFEPIRRALTGTYSTEGGETVKLAAAYHYGMPTDPAGMIKSIQDGRPFIFAWQGHVTVCYGLDWIDLPTLRVIELKLIDPLWPYGRPKYRTFNVFHDNPQLINGTLELLVK
jgi:hypothetical protein